MITHYCAISHVIKNPNRSPGFCKIKMQLLLSTQSGRLIQLLRHTPTVRILAENRNEFLGSVLICSKRWQKIPPLKTVQGAKYVRIGNFTTELALVPRWISRIVIFHPRDEFIVITKAHALQTLENEPANAIRNPYTETRQCLHGAFLSEYSFPPR